MEPSDTTSIQNRSLYSFKYPGWGDMGYTKDAFSPLYPYLERRLPTSLRLGKGGHHLVIRTWEIRPQRVPQQQVVQKNKTKNLRCTSVQCSCLFCNVLWASIALFPKVLVERMACTEPHNEVPTAVLPGATLSDIRKDTVPLQTPFFINDAFGNLTLAASQALRE